MRKVLLLIPLIFAPLLACIGSPEAEEAAVTAADDSGVPVAVETDPGWPLATKPQVKGVSRVQDHGGYYQYLYDATTGLCFLHMIYYHHGSMASMAEIPCEKIPDFEVSKIDEEPDSGTTGGNDDGSEHESAGWQPRGHP